MSIYYAWVVCLHSVWMRRVYVSCLRIEINYLPQSVPKKVLHDVHLRRCVLFPPKRALLDRLTHCCHHLKRQAVFSFVFVVVNQLAGVAHETWWTLIIIKLINLEPIKHLRLHWIQMLFFERYNNIKRKTIKCSICDIKASSKCITMKSVTDDIVHRRIWRTLHVNHLISNQQYKVVEKQRKIVLYWKTVWHSLDGIYLYFMYTENSMFNRYFALAFLMELNFHTCKPNHSINLTGFFSA